MGKNTVMEPPVTVEELQAQMAALPQRLNALEQSQKGTEAAPPMAAAPTPTPEPIPESGITEEELLVISAAIGAFLGVRAHIRQIRLLSSNAWAQQGRVSIQASHRLG